jgi:LmbE family N-acetylglucosaminyl deacetylase
VLPAAYTTLQAIAQGTPPQAILVHAYEGGHHDHDSCGVLGYRL